ncbi:MAG: precorrin-6Y C5,15-methyltransferase (decarboxylating) subunit CbiT [Nitrospirae bacterium]|nr:precorrin-6Y C5,15-methyltransferase (decarboxylating) subunit CbiT [Nitrospirota bacterium]
MTAFRGCFGIPDSEFERRKPDRGLITKMEIRVVSLAKLELTPESVVWDIGAGSGSVGIEAARLVPKGRVYAIEKNEEDFVLLQTNRDRCRVDNLTAVCDRAPDGLSAFPDPDAVFIGGTGSAMKGILNVVISRLRPGGKVVMNLVTLENLAEAVTHFRGAGWEVEYTLMQVSRSKPLLHLTRYDALNPVTIVSARRPIP